MPGQERRAQASESTSERQGASPRGTAKRMAQTRGLPPSQSAVLEHAGRSRRQKNATTIRSADDARVTRLEPVLHPLGMPSLKDIPSEFVLGVEHKNLILLTKHLLKAEIIEAEGFDPKNLWKYLNHALNEVVSLAFQAVKAEFDVAFSDDKDRFVVTLTSQRVLWVEFNTAFDWLSKIHPLAPRMVLDELKSAQSLGCIYDASTAFEQIQIWQWQGCEDDIAMIEELRSEIAESRKVIAETISDAEIRDIANSQGMYTNQRIDSILPRALREWLPTPERQQLEALLEYHPELKQLIFEIRAIKERSSQLPTWDLEMLPNDDLHSSYSYVLNLTNPDGTDAVEEMFMEYDQMVSEVGEWSPSYAFEIFPNGAGIETLKLFLEHVPKVLKQTEAIFERLMSKKGGQ